MQSETHYQEMEDIEEEIHGGAPKTFGVHPVGIRCPGSEIDMEILHHHGFPQEICPTPTVSINASVIVVNSTTQPSC